MRRAPLWVALFLLLITVVPVRSQTVYAAASLATALREVTQLLPDNEVRLSFASSSSLAKQIAAGAPADVYFSASAQWMDYLHGKELIAADTRSDLLANRLVVIAPEHHAFEVEGDPSFDFAGAFTGRLAVGDPSHVPVGMYARQSLENLDWFTRLADRLAPAPHARAALVYVERGECAAGIVYATDAAISTKVEVLVVLPANTHQPIVYPVAAIVNRDSEAVRRLLKHFQSPEAAAVFRRHGFLTVDQTQAQVPR
jgi:molybdate transport system substrate-binding protein